MALGPGDEEGGDIARADVIEVAGDAERFCGLLPADLVRVQPPADENQRPRSLPARSPPSTRHLHTLHVSILRECARLAPSGTKATDMRKDGEESERDVAHLGRSGRRPVLTASSGFLRTFSPVEAHAPERADVTSFAGATAPQHGPAPWNRRGKSSVRVSASRTARIVVAVGAMRIRVGRRLGWADIDSGCPSRHRCGSGSHRLHGAHVGRRRTACWKGRLKLDERPDVRPEFPEKPWPVTLRHVMAHVAGLRSEVATKDRCSRAREHPVDALQYFKDGRCCSNRNPVRYRTTAYSGERSRRRRHERAVPLVHAQAISSR